MVYLYPILELVVVFLVEGLDNSEYQEVINLHNNNFINIKYETMHFDCMYNSCKMFCYFNFKKCPKNIVNFDLFLSYKLSYLPCPQANPRNFINSFYFNLFNS